MRRTITLLCYSLAWIGAVLGCLAAEPQLQLEITLEQSEYIVGEPIAITSVLSNFGNEDLIHEAGIITEEFLAASVLLVRVLPDGGQEVIVSDWPAQIPPALPAAGEGEEAAFLVPASVIEPTETRTFLLPNLLRYIPFLEEGEYELVAFFILPWYGALAAEGMGADTGYVDVYAAQAIAVASLPLAFDVTAPASVPEEDLDELYQARITYAAASTDEEAVRAFTNLRDDTSNLYVEACAQYWIGEVYQRFRVFEEAKTAYEAVVTEFAASTFAAYAVDRLAEIEEVRETLKP